MKNSFARLACCLVALVVMHSEKSLDAAPRRGVIPGTGTLIEYASDNFEDTSWGFVNNFPKSSREQDERLRSPTGYSTNGRWIEGPERGHPDHMKVVPTPPGGVEGSKHALLIRTLRSGIPGYNSYDVQQDDLIANTISRIGMTIPVSDTPSVVAHVYLPPADQWEDRSGPHFGFRISASATVTKSQSSGFFGSRTSTEVEPYWPGIWVHFRSKGRKVKEDSAFLTVRGNRQGRDIKMKDISAEEFGWWTFGMSVTPDGMVHYFAKQGVEDLTGEDYLTSQYPYSFTAQRFRTYFFDVCNKNDGKTWSTPFVIDDPKLYVVNSSRVVSNVKRIQEREARRKAQRNAKKNSKTSKQKSASRPTKNSRRR